MAIYFTQLLPLSIKLETYGWSVGTYICSYAYTYVMIYIYIYIPNNNNYVYMYIIIMYYFMYVCILLHIIRYNVCYILYILYVQAWVFPLF